MARRKGSRTGRCQGCNHLERVRIERLLAAGASIKGTARKFEIDYHALRRHWINHVSAEARSAYIAFCYPATWLTGERWLDEDGKEPARDWEAFAAQINGGAQ